MANTAYFELGTNGNNVATTDPGNATAWTQTLYGNPTYSTTHVMHGSLAMKATSQLIGWTYAAQTDHYGRFYMWTANTGEMVRGLSSGIGGSQSFVFFLNGSGYIDVKQSTGGGAVTGNHDLRSKWVRIEYRIVHSATVGQIFVKTFDGDGTSPLDDLTSAANLNTLASSASIRYGSINGADISYYDSIMAAATNWPGPAIPINTVAPAVTGTTGLGDTLTCDTGTWTGDATITYAYQWQRDDSNIGGATAATRVIAAADQGHNLRCVVTAANGASTGVSANSDETAIPAGASAVTTQPIANIATIQSYYS